MAFNKKYIFVIVLIILIPLLLLMDRRTNYDIKLEIDKEISPLVYIVSNEDDISFIDYYLFVPSN